MNFAELQREVLSLVMDQSPNILVSVPDYINEAIQQIAEEARFPELRQVSSITTSTSLYYVNMPATFSSRLLYAGTVNGKLNLLEGGLEELLELHPVLTEVGDIKDAVCEGGIFYYQPIPAIAVTITCLGYHTPPVLASGADTPSFIPSFLHREAIVNAAAVGAYSIIEDGMEGDKINTKVFAALAENGLNKVRAYVSRRRPVVSNSNWSV
jgi:hypothetical protein